MAVKVIIPTPLRAYAGRQASVELQAATVRKHCGAHHKIQTSRSICIRRRPLAQLRKCVRKRRGHTLPTEGSNSLNEGDTVSIVPSIAGGARH
jgi:molybdopterin converting factor small subunit